MQSSRPRSVVVVGPSAAGLQGREGPDVADGRQALVLHLAVVDDQAFARGAGDRRGSCVGLERAGVGEAGAVVAELGEHAGAGEFAQAREAGDDGGVRVLGEGLSGCLGELVGGAAGRVQLQQDGLGLAAEGFFDGRELAKLLFAEVGLEFVGPRFDVALAAGGSQECVQAAAGELGGSGRGGRRGEDGAGLARGQVDVLDLEGIQRGGEVLAQQGTKLVGELLAVPGRAPAAPAPARHATPGGEGLAEPDAHPVRLAPAPLDPVATTDHADLGDVDRAPHSSVARTRLTPHGRDNERRAPHGEGSPGLGALTGMRGSCASQLRAAATPLTSGPE